MAVYIVTGKLGNGKTLVTVGRIYDAMKMGRRIATNLDLYPHRMFGRKAKDLEIIRVPDKPTIHDLNVIGQGYTGKYDESKFGVLVLDECGTWFNSRMWQDKTRKDVNDWFLHARKLRWDVYLIIQDISILDAQAREALAEHTVFCRRLDNIRIPLIGGLVKVFTGIRLKLPRIHHAKVVYGMTKQDLLSDTWTYRGTHMFNWYDTDQIFLANYPHGPYSMLTPWHLYGRYSVPMSLENVMRLTKIYWRRFKSPVALASGLLIGVTVGLLRFAPYFVPSDSNPSAPESLPEPSFEDVSEEVEKSLLVTRLRKLYIAGGMNVNNRYVHELADIDNKDITVYTTKDLASMGLKVTPKGECRIEVKADGELVPIYCL